jgi:pilus assembly protein CpaF
MPLHALRVQLASAVNIIVQVSRLQDGSRKVTHISEVLGWDLATETYQIQDIFHRETHGIGERGEILSEFVPTGYVPRCAEQVREHGMELPAAIYEAAKRNPALGHG